MCGLRNAEASQLVVEIRRLRPLAGCAGLAHEHIAAGFRLKLTMALPTSCSPNPGNGHLRFFRR
jgi:hypothetical protein